MPHDVSKSDGLIVNDVHPSDLWDKETSILQVPLEIPPQRPVEYKYLSGRRMVLVRLRSLASYCYNRSLRVS